MRKVLFVFGSLERAGAQLRTLEVCRVLRQRHLIHFDFCVLGLGPTQLQAEVENIGGTIHSVSIRSPRFIVEFSDLLRRGQYDIVHSIPLLLSGIVVYLAQKHRVPIRIASFRNSLGNSGGLMSSPLFIWLMRTLIKRSATHVIAVSRSALEDVFPPAWQSSGDCRVIYNGLALSSFQSAVERCEVREEFGWPSDSRVVINVARFSRQKNHRAILEATRLAQEHHRNIHLLLVGGGTLQDEITSLIDHYGLREICVMAGVRTDVPRLLLASDVFFFPSLWEGLPGALLEALVAGLPVVASDISPIQEIAQFFPSSILLASPDDAEKHAEHILTALDVPIDRASAQAHFARTPFALKNAIKAYSTLYGLTDGANE